MKMNVRNPFLSLYSVSLLPEPLNGREQIRKLVFELQKHKGKNYMLQRKLMPELY